MGGACSRKRDPQVNEDSLQRGVSGKYCRIGSSKWLGTSISRPALDILQGRGQCPSLMELCIYKIREDIDKYTTFSMLPRDISQQIFNELVFSQCLTDVSLKAFQDCALQDIYLGEYPGVNDSWMDVISSQGVSLLSVDLSGSEITNSGLIHLKDCTNLQALNLNYCDQISDHGLKHISGLSNLTTLSFRRNNAITAQGMSAFSSLVNLVKLDLERCPGIHGGLIHLKGLTKLESLNINMCHCITDADLKPLSGLTNLKGLEISRSKVTDDGVAYLKGGLLELKRPHLYWTPCAAHCLDLMLEDIGKIPNIKRTLERAISLNGYIYNRSGLLNMMRRFTGQRELLRPAKTRFATAFITLSRLHEQKNNLRKMFTSSDWSDSKWAKEQKGKTIANIVLMPSFWNTIVFCLKVSGPLVRVLRLVDGEKKAPMGYIYEAMNRAKDAIVRSFNGNEEKYKEVFNIIDKRWEIQLHRPLHAAGYFLNPEFFYDKPEIEHDAEIMSDLYKCILRLTRDPAKQEKVVAEVSLFTNAQGLFGNELAIRTRKTRAPGLHKLALLNMEGCPVTAACLESLSDLPSLLSLNLNRSMLSDDGCENFARQENLRVLNLGFNDLTDACLVHLKGLTNLESLNLDSCRICDEGLANLTGLRHLKCLELSDTEVGSNGLRHLSGLANLESINLSFTAVTDSGLRKLSALSSLKSLNLDARQITDAGLAALTSLTGLTHLDLFGARITDSGTSYLRNFKNLQSLEICGGGLTDAGVKNIKDLTCLTVLNLSQNCNLTDKSLELISGLTALVSLSVSNSRITNAGLQHLKQLKNLKSLTLDSCKVTVNDIKKLQSKDLPNLVSFRPE